MAITAAITLSSATANNGQQVQATCTVTNSGSSAVNVTGAQPVVTPHSANQQSVGVLVGQPNLGPGQTIAVAASGTLAFTFPVTPETPQVGNYVSNPFPSTGQGGAAITPLPPLAMPQSLVFDIGCQVRTSDGSLTTATTTTLTVSAAPTY